MKVLPTNMTIKWIYLVSIVAGLTCLANSQKQHKRQIYREQVLPALGGKIPDDAFRTDRLALNRLNKDGITVIDGVLLEAREHEKNPDIVRSKPEVIQVYLTQDSRYVPPEGRYHNERPNSVDTTYVIRKPVGNNRDGGVHQRLNGIGNIPINNNPNINRNNNNNNNKNINNNRNNNNNNGVYANGGYHKQVEIPPQGLSPPKAHGYVNFQRFVPIVSNNRLGQQQRQHQQQHYRTIYKPIITPLVIPARDIIFTKPYYRSINNYNNQQNRHPSWDLTYDWNSFYQPSTDSLFLEDNDHFFDSHQIITDYEGFLNTFNGRSYRHIGSSKGDKSGENLLKESKEQIAGPSVFSSNQERSNISNEKTESRISSPISRHSSPAYTDLIAIPETNFSCAGKKGTFADVETKCQVFHECSGWSKTSSLCPAGTAYSAKKKRCEWWNTVNCGSE